MNFFIDFYERHSIATEDFSPMEDPSLSEGYTTEKVGLIEDKGFLVRPNADGNLYGITLYAYNRNSQSLTGLTPEPFDGIANQWIECRFIKVYSKVHATYPSVATAITIGVTI